MTVTPYLFFEGRCEEALGFYASAVGGEVVQKAYYRDNPDADAGNCGANQPPGDKLMHAMMRIGDSVLMASDGMCSGTPHFAGFSISISAADVAHAKRMFAALAEGGQVQMPPGETFFAEYFGMTTDKFGLGWMVIAGAKP